VDPQRTTVTSVFGAPRGGATHQGIDLAAAKGTPVRATAAGRVTFAGRSGRFGRVVEIEHGGGWRTRYAHLSSIEARQGRRVERGSLIGRVGRSGNASGPHLHYEVWHHGRAVDPVSVMVEH
jgi:murein DD-endopeptidase MepM/ murein hydrolase activator NlpD